jgi:hypothetical protein
MELGDILKLLTDERRRTLLKDLDDRACRGDENHPVDLEWFDDPRAMRHVHLPMLEASEAIEYDQETGTVDRGPAFDEVKAVLDAVQNDELAVLDDDPPGGNDERAGPNGESAARNQQ